VEYVRMLLDHVSCIKSGTTLAVSAPTHLVSLSDVLELAIVSY